MVIFTVRYILSFSIQGEAGGCNEVPLIIYHLLLSGFPAILCPAAKFVLSPLYWILLCPAEPLHAIKMLNHVIKALPHPSLPAPHTEALWRQASGTTSRCIHCLYRGALQRHSAMSADRVPGVLWKNAEAAHL